MKPTAVPVRRAPIPSSSGGTHAGLLAGMRYHGLALEPLGIRIDRDGDDESFAQTVARLASTVAASFGLEEPFDDGELGLVEDYAGAYGVVGAGEREAIGLTARTEGILLDPVYTGRAMAALVDMIRRGCFSEDDRILFWHTGGTAALFAYAETLLAGQDTAD